MHSLKGLIKEYFKDTLYEADVVMRSSRSRKLNCLDFPNLKIWTSQGTSDWNHLMDCEDRNVPLEDAFIAQLLHFCRVIKKEDTPRITAEDATKTLAATLAVFDSAKQHRTITL